MSATFNKKNQTHKHFDLLWKCGFFTRKQAYIELKKYMEPQGKPHHISQCTTNDCNVVIEWSKYMFTSIKNSGFKCKNDYEKPNTLRFSVF